MRVAFVVGAVCVVLLGIAQAATPLSYPATTVTVALTATSNLPVTLSAGPQGSTSIGANATSASSTVDGGILSDTETNTTVLTNTGGVALRVRLVHVSIASGTTDCVRCDLQLRQGATTSAQNTIVNGGVTDGEGDWVTLQPAGSAQSVWWLWTLARGSVLQDKTMVVSYRIEIVPASALSPQVHYETMTMSYRV